MESFHLPTTNSAYRPTLTREAFRKNSNGSWTSVRNSDIPTPPDGLMRIGPDITFEKGKTFNGIDIVSLLEQN